jgi:hypothetical protein
LCHPRHGRPHYSVAKIVPDINGTLKPEAPVNKTDTVIYGFAEAAKLSYSKCADKW